jgi:phosphoribosylanthranilate isomerase
MKNQKRNFEGIIPELPKSIKLVLFVNEHLEILLLVEEYQLMRFNYMAMNL